MMNLKVFAAVQWNITDLFVVCWSHFVFHESGPLKDTKNCIRCSAWKEKENMQSFASQNQERSVVLSRENSKRRSQRRKHREGVQCQCSSHHSPKYGSFYSSTCLSFWQCTQVTTNNTQRVAMTLRSSRPYPNPHCLGAPGLIRLD